MSDLSCFMTINKFSQVPLYSQVKECIRSAIYEGRFLPGDKLPTEEEICKQFDISRPVVRQAYAELAAEHILERKRGHGSYVKRLDMNSMKLYQLVNFTEEMRMLGKKPGTQLISAGVIPYDDTIYQLLQLEETDVCFKLLRVRYADNVPFALVSNYLSLSRFKGIDRFDFAVESLYKVLEDHYHTKICKACRTIQAQIISNEAANLLQVKKLTAAHIVTSLSYNSADRPVEWSVEVFPGDSHEFSFTVFG